jgi:hypothetical protein
MTSVGTGAGVKDVDVTAGHLVGHRLEVVAPHESAHALGVASPRVPVRDELIEPVGLSGAGVLPLMDRAEAERPWLEFLAEHLEPGA